MKVLELFRYVAPGNSLNFNELYNLGKVKRYYSDKETFEIDLENALDEGLIGVKRIDDENRFYKI